MSELRSKYAEMHAMRLADAGGADDARRVRLRMQRLAERHPGALREIDALPLAEIRRRIAALDAVLAGEREPDPWVEAVARFHALTRGVLVAKRWLGRRRRVDDALQREFERELLALPYPEDSRAWSAHLALVAAPPRGRLMDAVFTRVAASMGLPVATVRALVFAPASQGAAGTGSR